MSDVIDVAIGVLVCTKHGSPQILIARRPHDTVLAGYWELPGGKVESNETMVQCLVREFKEELNIVVEVHREIAVVEHAYDHGHVRLHAFYCSHVSGVPQCIEVEAHKWVSPSELLHHDFPPANDELIRMVVNELNMSGHY